MRTSPRRSRWWKRLRWESIVVAVSLVAPSAHATMQEVTYALSGIMAGLGECYYHPGEVCCAWLISTTMPTIDGKTFPACAFSYAAPTLVMTNYGQGWVPTPIPPEYDACTGTTACYPTQYAVEIDLCWGGGCYCPDILVTDILDCSSKAAEAVGATPKPLPPPPPSPPACQKKLWCQDGDGDGKGSWNNYAGNQIESCEKPAPWSDIDCLDKNKPCQYVPDCSDGCDNNKDIVLSVYWYPDADGDGFGVEEGKKQACKMPAGYAAKAGDNCPDKQNADQKNVDQDGAGDVCDACPTVSNGDQVDTDGQGLGDACDPDDDGDGIGDTVETNLGTNPLAQDTDGDLLSDRLEILSYFFAQSEGIQGNFGFFGNLAGLGFNPKQGDSDSDGQSDLTEFKAKGGNSDVGGTNPGCAKSAKAGDKDADGDGYPDSCDIDIDGDGLTNIEEIAKGINPNFPDSDGDGLDDQAELTSGTNPLQIDSDTDGFGDGSEVHELGTNPLESDSDKDGLSDYEDVGHDTDPLNPDTDYDGLNDYVEVKVVKSNPRKPNTDGDPWNDGEDSCPIKASNVVLPDSDGDKWGDACDNCPKLTNFDQADPDADWVGQVCDNCPTVAALDQTDSDGDGSGNPCDPDDDNDGWIDTKDNCRLKKNWLQQDTDKDGLGDVCDPPTLAGPGNLNAPTALPEGAADAKKVQESVPASFVVRWMGGRPEKKWDLPAYSGETTSQTDADFEDSMLLKGPFPRQIDIAGDGGAGNGDVLPEIALSSTGRYVAFASFATNLVTGDSNNEFDLYVHDNQIGGMTERINLDPAGQEAVGGAEAPSMSAEGRYVAFVSAAANLVPGDTNGQDDVFVRDRQTGVTTRVSVDPEGKEMTLSSWDPSISAGGRYVAFGSYEGGASIFVHDRESATTELVSVGIGGKKANNGSWDPAISGEGWYVVFRSLATNLVANDTSGQQDIFVRDRETGTTTRVILESAGEEANGPFFSPAISADGRYVAFASSTKNLVAGDTNEHGDIFVHDRQVGTTVRISGGSGTKQANGGSTAPTLSADGRYVVFQSSATNLVAGDTNGHSDVFVYDRQIGQTARVSGKSGDPQDMDTPQYVALSANGRYIAFVLSPLNSQPASTPDGKAFHLYFSSNPLWAPAD